MNTQPPLAETVPAPGPLRWLAWAVPVAALVVAGLLTWQGISQRGPEIVITFQDGRGIRVGDAVLHRGVRVGAVEAVSVTEDLTGAHLRVRLTHDARALASEGSRFWIVRPELSLQRVTGLETLIGSRYVAVEPGEGQKQTRFQGLEDIPLDVVLAESTLDIVLAARSRGSVEVGAPVYYREVRVGVITSIDFSQDRRRVEMRAGILPQHAHLVRDNSRFWESTGIGIDAGLFGFELQTGSLDTILAGGVGFATPTRAGEPVTDGHRFDLSARPEDSWLEWTPDLSPPAEVPSDAVTPGD